MKLLSIQMAKNQTPVTQKNSTVWVQWIHRIDKNQNRLGWTGSLKFSCSSLPPKALSTVQFDAWSGKLKSLLWIMQTEHQALLRCPEFRRQKQQVKKYLKKNKTNQIKAAWCFSKKGKKTETNQLDFLPYLNNSKEKVFLIDITSQV